MLLSGLNLHQRTLGAGLVLGLVITLAFQFGLQGIPPFQRAELGAFDWQLQHRGAHPIPPEIALVALDNASLQDLTQNRYPIPRTWMARAVTNLHRAGARVIGIDFLFVAPSQYGPADDRTLAHAIRGAGNVVLAQILEGQLASNNIGHTATLLSPIDQLTATAAGVGLANVPQDSDSVIRSSLLMQPGPGGCRSGAPACARLYPALPLEVAAVGLRRPVVAVLNGLPTSMLINYRGAEQAFHTYQFESVARGEDDPSLFRNKIVLIIPAANVTKDILQAPYGTTYGGLIQANVLATILARDPLTPLGDFGNSLVLLVLGLLATLAASRFDVWRSAGAVLLLMLLFVVAVMVAFSIWGFWINLVTPLACVVLIFAAIMALRFATEERQRRKTGKVFGHYVKPEIVEMLVNAGDPLSALAGRRQPISVLFVDIRGFTSMSEGLEPEQVVSCLDIYLEELTESVNRFDGTLDKYVGDELMAIWNAPREQPDHAMRCVQSALDMVGRMDGINGQLAARNLPPIHYGIGVNSGEAVVGQMGSSLRKQYDVIGDAVNTGARLCSAAPGGHIIIGEVTWEMIGHVLDVEETEPLTLKGKSRPLRTFRVLGVRTESASVAVSGQFTPAATGVQR